MSIQRATNELGWRPTIGADEAVAELLRGIAEHAHADTPMLNNDRFAAGRLLGLLRGRVPGHGNPY